MPKINLNFAGTGGDNFEPLPEDTYSCQVENAEVTDSKAGNPGINLTLRVTDPGEYMNRKFWDWTSLGETSRWRIRQNLEVITGEKYPPEEKFEFDTDDLIGRHARAVIYQDEYNGTVRNKVKRFLPALPNGENQVLNLPPTPPEDNPFGTDDPLQTGV